MPGGAHHITDLGVFVRPALAYGWINGKPVAREVKAINASMWRSVGHLLFAPPTLRTIIGGAHIECDHLLLVRQLRVLEARNRDLVRLGYNLHECETHVDKMVKDGMEGLGWQLNGQSWRHEKVGSFLGKDVLDRKQWKLIAHLIRDTVRPMPGNVSSSQIHEIAGKKGKP